LAWFWYKGTIPKGYKPRLLALLALGGLQGAVGWWMVSSGLSADVKVSHYRLAVHLLVALTTLGGLIWTALDLKALRQGEPPARLTGFASLVLGILFIQILFGALVAGLRAGYVAGAGWFSLEAWPLMQGSFFPEGIDWARGFLAALFEDPFLVHFVHRWWAWVAVAALIVLARKFRALRRRDISIAVHSAFGTQILLGIATIWSGMALWLAVTHQLVGALVVAATVWGAHALGRQG
jgi:cytochrome c oxidase assembly protein subunit 15